jgi:hypothetical protein
MPALMWVAFWSWLMGTAACIGETPRLVRAKMPERRDRPQDHPAV